MFYCIHLSLMGIQFEKLKKKSDRPIPLKQGWVRGNKNIFTVAGLPWSGKKVWKMKFFPGQGNVREFWYESGKFRKNAKSHGISNFP